MGSNVTQRVISIYSSKHVTLTCRMLALLLQWKLLIVCFFLCLGWGKKGKLKNKRSYCNVWCNFIFVKIGIKKSIIQEPVSKPRNRYWYRYQKFWLIPSPVLTRLICTWCVYSSDPETKSGWLTRGFTPFILLWKKGAAQSEPSCYPTCLEGIDGDNQHTSTWQYNIFIE